MAIWDVPARLWTIARKVEELLELQGKTRSALELVETRLRALEDRMTRLEAGREQLVTEARTAAGVAATSLAGSAIADVVTRLTRIEMQVQSNQPLPPPSA